MYSSVDSKPAPAVLVHPAAFGTNTSAQISQTPTISTLFYAAFYYAYPLLGLLFALFAYQLITWLNSENPPRGSGLKRLPGPRSTLPYLGRFHDLDEKHVWKSMKKFSDQYNGLFSMTLGGETHIWVGREDVAQDLLCKNGAVCGGRADLGAYPHVTEEFHYLPLMGYTGYITLETKRFMKEILTSPSEWYTSMNMFCARISSRLAYGSDESASFHSNNASNFIRQLGPSGPIMNKIPFLRYFPEWIVTAKREVRERREAEAEAWTKFYHETKARIEEGELKSFNYVSASLECQKAAEPGKELLKNDIEAVYAVGMMCTVAIFTIGGPAVLFFMAMILHPEWQEKVRRELDEMIGDKFVELEDSPKLPILRAAIKESLRWKSTVPLGVPRLLEDNYSYEGYHFPKYAIVHVLDVALARDDSLYPDAEIYNPARWLDEKYPTFRTPATNHPQLPGHHIFGRGRRMCPGQNMAQSELLVLCGNIIKNFVLGPKVDKLGEAIWPDPENWTSNVIGGPLPFECDIQVRSKDMSTKIESMYCELFDR